MKVYVGNMPKDLTDAEFDELLKPFGTPESANLIKDKMTGAPRGFAFVEYKTDAEAKAAIAGLNGKDVRGQALKANESQPKK